MIGDKMKQRLGIRLLASDERVLDQTVQDIVDTAKRTGVKVGGPVLIPFTATSGRFQNRTYQRIVYIIGPTENTISELKKLNVPSGVEIQIKL